MPLPAATHIHGLAACRRRWQRNPRQHADNQTEGEQPRQDFLPFHGFSSPFEKYLYEKKDADTMCRHPQNL